MEYGGWGPLLFAPGEHIPRLRAPQHQQWLGAELVRGFEPGTQSPANRVPEYKACWEEPPTAEEMVQVECLLAEIAKLIGAVVALSFCKRLTQSIQERVHPAYDYRVARVMAGQI